MHTIGSRRQVWNGTAKKTPGGLLKSDLMMNKHGRIVSRAKHASAKRENRLVKAGYGTKKGSFGFVKMGSRKMRKGSKKHMKGGHSNIYSSMSPANYNGIAGQGITVGDAGSANVQLLAGMAGGRRRRRRGMMMMGGSGMNGQSMMSPSSLSSEGSMMSGNGMYNGIAGQGITVGDAGSANVQLLAGMAGGRRRRHRKMMMMGGTTSQSNMALKMANMGKTGNGPQTRAAMNS